MYALEGQTYVKYLFFANQASNNRGLDVKEIKYFVYSHTQTCV